MDEKSTSLTMTLPGGERCAVNVWERRPDARYSPKTGQGIDDGFCDSEAPSIDDGLGKGDAISVGGGSEGGGSEGGGLG